MKKALTILSAAALLFAGCDKIASDEYTVYDGASVVWASSAHTVNPVQRAYVEKYTGPKCNNCPSADVTLDAAHDMYGDRLVTVSINHPVGMGVPFPGQPDMRTAGGTVWDQFFGINAIPAAYLNRDRSVQYLGEMSNITAAIGTTLQESPEIGLELSALTQNDDIVITVNLSFTKEHNIPLTLTVALIEDSLTYIQLNGNDIDSNYVHNHMLRKVITSYWGADVKSTGKAGEDIAGFLYCKIPDDVKMENSHIVAFISDKSSKRVLNSASCKITTEEEYE
jgi:hypothetical protein